MWQELRDYWLPLMLCVVTLFLASLLLLLIVLMPLALPYLPFTHPLIQLFADDATVRRTCIVGAAGLFVTAVLFFRPNRAALRKSSSRKPPQDTMAGA